MGRACCIHAKQMMHIVLVVKHEGNRLLGWFMHRWVNNINLNKYNGRVNWIHVAQDRNQ
jgi:hypothetical protein